MARSNDMPEKKPLVVTRGLIWGSLAVAVVALICVRLGIWQLQRLEEKRERNHATRQRMAQPPASLSALTSDSAGLIFRRVTLTGQYDDAHTIIIAGRSLRGVPGVHVLTPMRIGGSAVLVNRGWMPSADAARIELDSIIETPPENLQALVTPFPEDHGNPPADSGFHRTWYQMDGQRLRNQFPYPVMPFLAQILPHAGQPPFPIRLRPPEFDEGPHLGYAIQWFSFACIAIIGWTIVFMRSRKD
jgi:surfeit locus 1 family protein